MSDENVALGCAEQDRPRSTADQEAWVTQRLRTAIRMAAALQKERGVGADEAMYLLALEGVIEGAAYEIIQTLGLVPSCINIRNPFPRTGEHDERQE